MSISVTINGGNFTEALEELRGFAGPLMGSTSLARGTTIEQALPAAPQPEPTKDAAPDPEPAKRRGRPPKNPEPAAAPPTPEPPKPANPPAPSAADAKQDDADEAAETAAEAAKAPALTANDVSAAMHAYADKFGMPAAQADIAPLWKGVGITVTKRSDLKDGEFEPAVRSIREALDANPFKRAVVEKAA